VDDLHKFVGAIPVMSGKAHQFTGSFEYGIPVGRAAGDRRTSAPPELDKTLIADGPQRSQHRVVVHTQHGSKIPRGRKTIPGLRFPVTDGSSNLSGHLLMKGGAIGRVDPWLEHNASERSPIIFYESSD